MHGYTAVGLSWIGGESHPPTPVSPAVVGEVLTELAAVDARPFAALLDRPGQHWGGHRRRRVLLDEVIPRLLPRNQKTARAAVQALAELPPLPPSLVHGDLAGHNMLWQGEDLVGVIDWDHASLSDPAQDLASLALWHGWSTIRRAVPEQMVERACLHARIFPLQAVAYAIKHQLDLAQVHQALVKADDWFESGQAADLGR